jgi:hypothetical protein
MIEGEATVMRVIENARKKETICGFIVSCLL